MKLYSKIVPLTLMLSVSSAVALPSMGRAQEMNPPATSALPGDQSQQTPAGKFIQDLGDHAIAIVRNKSLTSDQRAAQYKAMLNNAFDLQTIGRFVLGRAYISAPPEQQQEFMKLFADLIVKIYGDRLNFYSGESFHVKGVRQESDQDMIVNSQIDHPNGADPTLIDWRVRNSNGKLAVIDVIVSGVSQSVTQRQEYSSIIQQGGGKLDALLDRMRQQTQSGPNTNG